MANHRIAKKPIANGRINGRLSLIDDELNVIGEPAQVRSPLLSGLVPDPNVKYPEVSMGYGKLSAQLVFVTAELAEEWLKTRLMDKQRTLKTAHLASIVRDMTAGLFVLNGQTVVMDWHGRLMDGQHRLEAVIRSGVGVWVIVIRGVDPHAFGTIDSAAKRSAADALKSLGYVNTSCLGASCSLVWKYENNLMNTNAVVSKSIIAQVIARHPGLVGSAAIGSRVAQICPSASVPSFCHYLFSKIDEPLANIFFHKLITGEDLHKGDPVLTLRRKCTTKEDLSFRVWIAYFFKAWNALRNGNSLTKLGYNPYIESFPTPI